MSENGMFKWKKVYFAQVSNEALRDRTLSLKAKGLYALIQSYITIPDFILYKSTLTKECKEGETAFENTWKELKDKGYLLQFRHQRVDGTFYYEYELLDESIITNRTPENHPPVNHTVENHPPVNPPSGNTDQYNNTNLNNTNKLKEEEETIKPTLNLYYECKGKVVSPTEKKLLNKLTQEYTVELVDKAIEVMSERADKPSISYLRSTLEDWMRKGIDTLEKAITSLSEHDESNRKLREQKRRRLNKVNDSKSGGNFNNFTQRDYDFDAFEKQYFGYEDSIDADT